MKKLFSFLLVVFLICSLSTLFASADEATAETENPLYKKSVLFVGDSICEAYCERDNELIGWAGRIMKWNEMTGINKGKGGASISNCRGANTVLNQLSAVSGKTYDFVIIHGGVNDAWDVAPIGEITEGFDSQFDLTTFAGGLEATFNYAKKAFKNARIGYVINFSLPSANYGTLKDMSEYFTIAKEICDKWEIPYLDLYFDDDFNKNQLKTAVNTYLPDYIHPNTAGYDIIAPVINDWMKTLAVAQEESSVPEVDESSVTEVSENSDIADSGNNPPIYIYVLGAALAVAVVVLVVVLIKRK